MRKAAASTEGSDQRFVRLSLPAPAGLRHDAIEIVLLGGHRLIVGKDVDVTALKRVIEALEQR